MVLPHTDGRYTLSLEKKIDDVDVTEGRVMFCLRQDVGQTGARCPDEGLPLTDLNVTVAWHRPTREKSVFPPKNGAWLEFTKYRSSTSSLEMHEAACVQ